MSVTVLVLGAMTALSLPALCDGETNGSAASFCTYEMQVWNVHARSGSRLQAVRRPYGEIGPSETDPVSGCTVCSEDQVEIQIPPLEPFRVCRTLAPKVHDIVARLVRNGAPLRTVRGYRVVLSRGAADGNGDRTEFSNHAFGTAIDINPEQNGLYDDCRAFGPGCRLLQGGEWRPGIAGSLTADGETVTAFKAAGFKWGGEIAGNQKDFMHFSLTGY